MQGVAVPAALGSPALSARCGAGRRGGLLRGQSAVRCVRTGASPCASPDMRRDRGVCFRDGAVICQRDVLRHENKCVRKIVS